MGSPAPSIAVLGLDIGLATFGWALARVSPHEIAPVELGVIRTKPRTGKGFTVNDDLHRRGQELCRSVDGVLSRHEPVVVCAESWSQPPHASAAAKIARAWGVVDCVLQQHGLGLMSAAPQAIKLAATGRVSASKEQVLAGLDRMLGRRVSPRLVGITPSMQEHPVDALGAIVACRNDDLMRVALRLAEGRAS